MSRLSFADARDRLRALAPLAACSVPIGEAVGATLADDVRALADIPHFASSAMDGWAVAGEGPWRIVPASGALAPGTASEIVTGGVIPDGATSVLRSEAGLAVDGTLRADDPDGREVRPGRHIRPAGEEARAGDALVAAGLLLTPPRVAVAAVAGHDSLAVRRPEVDLLLTGDEVDIAGMPPAGRVRDAFGPQIPAVVAGLGGLVVRERRIGDDDAATLAALDDASGDVLVTTGGTGRSGADRVRAALLDRADEVLVDGIAVRPGGPTLAVRLRDGRIALALPGNPLAAMVALVTLGGPLLRALAGRRPDEPRHATVAAEVPGHPHATALRAVRTTSEGVVAAGFDGSAMLRGLADADGILVVPPGGLAAGASGEVVALPW